MRSALKTKIIERFGHQWKFAEKVEMDETVVSKIVRRGKPLRPEERRRWAKALGCSASDPIFE